MAREIVEFKLATSVMETPQRAIENIRVVAKCNEGRLWLWEGPTWSLLPELPEHIAKEKQND